MAQMLLTYYHVHVMRIIFRCHSLKAQGADERGLGHYGFKHLS